MIGHAGCSSTVQRIRAKCHSWKRMHHDIHHRLIRQCAYCQKTDQRQIHNMVQPKVTSNAMVPIERICVDSNGELPSSGEPNNYLVVLDTFTRWVELYPLRSTDAVEAADSLL
jgi:hypothetical protein